MSFPQKGQLCFTVSTYTVPWFTRPALPWPTKWHPCSPELLTLSICSCLALSLLFFNASLKLSSLVSFSLFTSSSLTLIHLHQVILCILMPVWVQLTSLQVTLYHVILLSLLITHWAHISTDTCDHPQTPGNVGLLHSSHILQISQSSPHASTSLPLSPNQPSPSALCFISDHTLLLLW